MILKEICLVEVDFKAISKIIDILILIRMHRRHEFFDREIHKVD